jgi:hypothetical protein
MNVLVLRYSVYYCQPVLDRAESAVLVTAAPGPGSGLPPEVLARFDRVYTVSSYDSIEELAAVAADLLVNGIEIDRIATFTEFTQYAAGCLAGMLGVDLTWPALSLRTRDKRVMKQLASRAGVPCARFHSVPDCASADLDAIEAAVGYPMVVKPANGFGTYSTVRIDDPEQLAKTLAGFSFHPELCSHQLIAEEYIDGTEFHVDAVWRDGEPWVFCVSRYLAPMLAVATAGGMDCSVLLAEQDHPGLYADILAMHRELNGALGLDRGATHLEVFREHGTGRLLFSELASRLGGANIPQVVGARCGVDERELFAHELLDGDVGELSFTDGEFRYVGSLNLIPAESGTACRVPDPDALLADSNVLAASVFARVGDTILLSDRSVWYALLVIGADSEDELERAARRISAEFAIRVD